MFRILTVKNGITMGELKELAHEGFKHVVKAVVDTKQGIMAVGGELHVDMQVELIEQENSKNEDTWGINLYVDQVGDDLIEFDSMVNLKPSLGNNTRNVESEAVQEKIRNIVSKLVKQ